MVKLVNRAKVSTPTLGTGPLTIGPATKGFQTLQAAGVQNGDVLRYVIEEGDDWEIGTGTYASSGPVLTRSYLESSTGALLSLTGEAVLYVTGVAEDFVQPADLAAVATSGAYADLAGRPSLGTAAAQDISDFATAAQGTKADTAVQPSSLAPVATSGSYSALTGRPTLGTAASKATTDFATAAQGAKADTAVQPNALAAVATSGAYGDLSGVPNLASLIPTGVIVMWSGALNTIPVGWYLCDGANGTPNLKDRFVIGAGGAKAVGASGGSATASLSLSNVPSHTHSFSASTSTTGGHTHSGSTSTTGNHRHSVGSNGSRDGSSGGIGAGYSPRGIAAVPYGAAVGYYDTFPSSGEAVLSTNGNHSHSFSTNSTGDHSHTLSGTTGAAGSGAAFDITPPYYALAYIMKG